MSCQVGPTHTTSQCEPRNDDSQYDLTPVARTLTADWTEGIDTGQTSACVVIPKSKWYLKALLTLTEEMGIAPQGRCWGGGNRYCGNIQINKNIRWHQWHIQSRIAPTAHHCCRNVRTKYSKWTSNGLLFCENYENRIWKIYGHHIKMHMYVVLMY